MINKWDEIKNQKWDSLLLGNGFSIGISDRFSYKSLLDNVEKYNLRMYPHAKDLFIKIGTTNFEEILRVIYHAYLVNFYSLDAIKTLYRNVRRTLIESVNISHVEYKDVPTERIESTLKSYSKIFTTNYDLIPYWSFMNSRDVSFCDFFWNSDCVFNINDTDIWDHKKPIFYLHGAIHLKTNLHGDTFKTRATRDMSISEIIDETQFSDTPLFISEGKSEIKLRRIRENDYLNFCLSKLINLSGNIVVYGHGLDKEYDEHIINALKASSISNIAISVFSKLHEKEKLAFTANLSNYFADTGKNVLFFESETHPLAQVKST